MTDPIYGATKPPPGYLRTGMHFREREIYLSGSGDEAEDEAMLEIFKADMGRMITANYFHVDAGTIKKWAPNNRRFFPWFPRKAND